MRIANLTLVGVVFSPTENYISMDNVTKFTLLTGVHTLVRSSDDVKDVLQKNRDTFLKAFSPVVRSLMHVSNFMLANRL